MRQLSSAQHAAAAFTGLNACLVPPGAEVRLARQQHAAQPEVGDLGHGACGVAPHPGAAGQQHVVRLQVAVADGQLVQVAHASGHVAQLEHQRQLRAGMQVVVVVVVVVQAWL
jgi:hypothetical protein